MVRPGGELAKRPLHFIWLADCSGSMAGSKIQSLNTAIREAIPHMRDVANNNPNAEVLCRAISFDTQAVWHIPQPTPIDQFQWKDLKATGVTAMGAALKLLANDLDVSKMPTRALPPVLVLLSDGAPTDDFNADLKALIDKPWGKKAVRIAIAIGQDTDLKVLQDFIGHPEIKPLQADNSAELLHYIRWASTEVLQAASAPPSRTTQEASNTMNVALTSPPPPNPEPQTAMDTW